MKEILKQYPIGEANVLICEQGEYLGDQDKYLVVRTAVSANATSIPVADIDDGETGGVTPTAADDDLPIDTTLHKQAIFENLRTHTIFVAPSFTGTGGSTDLELTNIVNGVSAHQSYMEGYLDLPARTLAFDFQVGDKLLLRGWKYDIVKKWMDLKINGEVNVSHEGDPQEIRNNVDGTFAKFVNNRKVNVTFDFVVKALTAGNIEQFYRLFNADYFAKDVNGNYCEIGNTKQYNVIDGIEAVVIPVTHIGNFVEGSDPPKQSLQNCYYFPNLLITPKKERPFSSGQKDISLEAEAAFDKRLDTNYQVSPFDGIANI